VVLGNSIRTSFLRLSLHLVLKKIFFTVNTNFSFLFNGEISHSKNERDREEGKNKSRTSSRIFKQSATGLVFEVFFCYLEG